VTPNERRNIPWLVGTGIALCVLVLLAIGSRDCILF
jgi:hypothetical protein